MIEGAGAGVGVGVGVGAEESRKECDGCREEAEWEEEERCWMEAWHCLVFFGGWLWWSSLGYGGDGESGSPGLRGVALYQMMVVELVLYMK